MSKAYLLNRKISFTLTFFLSFILVAQELPLVKNYSAEDYKGESQNWSLSQSTEGYLYAANNKGLLEHNGARCKLYSTPNETIMRSVKAIGNSIYTGFYMDFGYWKRNDFGNLEYISLVKNHEIPVIEDEQFWNILELDQWVLFQSLQRIYLFNPTTKSYRIINSDVKITKMYKVDNVIYFQKQGKGIYKIEKGIAKLVSDANVFKQNDVIDIYIKEDKLLLLTNSKGFYFLDNKGNVSFWNIKANEYLANKTIYSSYLLNSGKYAVGTISNGVTILTREGEVDFTISKDNELPNNTILSIFQEKKGNLWLGLDNGISSLYLNSFVKSFTDKRGNLGTVYTSAIYDGNLYLGTNQGLFFRKNNSKQDFSLVKGTQGQVWFLEEIDNKLFCGHDLGTIILKDNKIINKINVQGTWGVKKLSNGNLLQGNYSGLYVLNKINDKWSIKNKIEGFNNSSRFFETYTNNRIFVNHEYKGVFKLQLNQSFSKALKVEKDTTVKKGIHSSIIKYNDKIFYAYKKGVFVFDDNKNSFIKDTLLSKLYSEDIYTSAKLVLNKESNTLWSFSKKGVSSIHPSHLINQLSIHNFSLSEDIKEGAIGYENVLEISKNKFLLGINNGYLILNTKSYENIIKESYTININSVDVNQLEKPKVVQSLLLDGNFSDKENNVDISFSIPSLTNDLGVEYQYKLKGQLDKWSNWSSSSKVHFENLRFGDYEFNVRGKVGNTLSSNVGVYVFKIQRPWFLSNVAIISYVLLLILFSLFMDRLYKTYYRKQRKALLDRQEREFKIKVLASEKELIEIRNNQLKIDVDSKNKELATSTMSIVKKNELLSSIKNELYKGGDENIKNVIHIIDKSLNNSDDWEMFKEAFNNADKNFIKKIKNTHNSLTPNDLRLCAYLRLNLSSKEIAPLLNISPRSVEVKRYRLRKKMNLEHDVNLTDYILSI